MKLVLLITGLSTGGAEMMLLKVLKHIDRNQFSPHVISLTTKGEIGSQIEALNIPVEALGMTPGRPGLRKFLTLINLLRELSPDVVHTWMYHADLLGGLAARLARIKAVGWGVRHSNLSSKHNKLITLLVVRICASLSRWVPLEILCCSSAARSIHAAAGYKEGKLAVIPNGFNLTHFAPAPEARGSVREELGLAADTPLVGLISRFDPQKNHAGFFESAAQIQKQRSDVHFIIAGKGIEQGNVELWRMVAQTGVQHVTHLLGKRDDVPRLMASLDVLASSSHGEAFPNVLGEAMACGVPCVVTDVGDSAEIVGDTGRVVPPGDMAGLAQGVVEILNLPAGERLRLGEKARTRVQENYEIGSVVKLYEEFYLGLAKNGLARCHG